LQREDWETKCGALAEQMKQMTSERNSLSEALDNLQREDWETKCGALTEQMKQMTSEWNSLSEALDQRCNVWETKCGELTEQLKQITSERLTLSEALDNQVHEFLAEKKVLEETIDLLARDSDDWQEKYNKSHNELAKVTDACDGLQIVLHEARASMNDSQQRCEVLTTEKISLQEENEILTKEVDTQSSEKKSLQIEVDTLHKMIEGIHATKDIEVSNLQRELKSASASLIGASHEINTLSVKSGILEKDKDEWQSKYKESTDEIAKITSSCDGLKTELNSVQASMNDLKKICEQLSIEKASLQKQIGDLTKEIDDQFALKRSLQQEIESLKAHATEITAAKELEVGNLRHELESATESLTEAASARDNLTTEIGPLRQELAFFAKDSVHWHEKYVKCANDLVELQSKYAGLETELQGVRETVDGSNRTIDDISNEKSSMQKDITDLTKKLDEHYETNTSLQQEIDYLQYKLEAIKLAKEREVENLQQELNIASSLLSGSSNEIEKLLAENSSLREKIRTLKADMESSPQITRRLECTEAKNESLASEVDYLKSENGTLQHQIQNLQCYVSEITACHDNSIEVISPTHMQQAEKEFLSAKNDALQQMVDALQEKLSEYANANEAAAQAFQLTIDGLCVQLAEREKTSEVFAQQLNDIERRATQEQKLLQSNIVTLEADLQHSKQEEDRVRNAMESLEMSQTESLAKMKQDRSGYEEQIKAMGMTLDSVEAKVTSLELELLRSKEKEEMLRGDMALMELSHAEVLAQMEEEKAALQGNLKSLSVTLDTEKEDSGKELKQLRSKIAMLEADRLRAKHEEDALRSGMSLLESKLAESSTQLEHSQADFLTLKQAHDDDMENACREQNKLKSQIELIEEKLVHSKEEENKFRGAMRLLESSHVENIARLEDEKAESQSNIKSLNLRLDATNEEVGLLRSKNESLEDNLLRSMEEEKNLRIAMELLESSHAANVANLLSRLEELRDHERALEQEMSQRIRDLTTDVESASNKLVDANSLFEDQKADLSKALNEKNLIVNNLEDKLQELSHSIDVFTVEAEAANEKICSLQLELDETKSEACRDKEQLSSRIASLKEDLFKSKQDADTLRGALISLEMRNDDIRAHFQDEINGFQAQFTSLTEKSAAEKKHLEEKVQTLEIRTQTLSQKENKQQEEISQLIQKSENAQVSLDASVKENIALIEKCRSLEDEVQKQFDQVGKLTNSITDMQSSLAVLKEHNENLCIDLSKVTKERDLALSKVEGLSGELNLTAIALSQVQELINKDQILAAETQQQLRSLEAEKNLLEKSILLIRSDRDNIDEQLEFSKKEAEDYRLKWVSSESIVESITNRCELIDSEARTSKQAVLKLNEKLESSESLAKTMEDQCDQLRSTIAELTTKSNEANALIKVLQAENHRNIARCRQQEERSNSEIVCLENIIKSLKTEYEAFKVEAKAAAAAQLRSCEAKLDSLCAMNENSIPRSQDRSFDDRITMLRKDRIKLIENLRSTAQQFEASQQNISVLEHAVASLKKEFEAFRLEADAAATAQMKSCMAKLKPLCSFREGGGVSKLQFETFDEIIEMIKNELASTLSELEVAHDEKLVLDEQVCILSTEVSKYKLQTKGLLKALDDITKNL
jgi:chromosome segregation ATPase